MNNSETKFQWENAAQGWARWENKITKWMEPATTVMFDMAEVNRSSNILDIACGAGSQTLEAAKAVEDQGHVTACDISETMLNHVNKNAQAAGLKNISTRLCSAEELDFPERYFNSAICRLGLMLFREPAKTVRSVWKSLKSGGKFSVVVFTSPDKNLFMSGTMEILLRHAGKQPPSNGQPGIFALGAPEVLSRLFSENGFVNYQQKTLNVSLELESAAQALNLVQEAFGAYRAVISDCSEEVKKEAWNEVFKMLNRFETHSGFNAWSEVIVASGTKPVLT